MRLSLVFIIAILLISLLANRQYLYLGYQNLAAQVGVNLNNISTNDYVSFIKSQTDEAQNIKTGIFLNQPVAVTPINVPPASPILGEKSTVDDNKWIDIDLSEQRLYMKEGDQSVASFLISSGKWSPTPTGQWRIWTKLRYTRMTGGAKALNTFYDLPNVPYVMYYYQGYGIHGAYWHNNFGQPMSHGCVNMKPEEAGIVFNWAEVGTRVIVHE